MSVFDMTLTTAGFGGCVGKTVFCGQLASEGDVATDGWITVREVEDIHHALNLGVDVARVARALAGKKQITLPALVEYGCLRWACPDLPELPAAIQASELGQEIRRVVSPFGLRTTGTGRPMRTGLGPCSFEFMTFASEEEVAGDDAELFKSRFWKSARHVGFANSVARFLAVGLHEMMTNAVQHASSAVPMLAGYAVYAKTAQFAVADVGQGVLAALRSSPKFEQVRLHADAIRLAIQPGVTSDPSGNGGFGFRDIFQALAEQWGFMRFRSGEACVVADGTGLDSQAGESRPVPPLAGFQVSVTCRCGANGPDHPTV